MNKTLETIVNQGVKVFPWSIRTIRGKQEKVPLIKHGHLDASSNPTQIQYWAEAFPKCNWGAVYPEDIFVIDLDVKNGENGYETWKTLHRANPDTPMTQVHQTMNDGYHLFYKSNGVDIRRDTSKTKLGGGIDILGKGGWVAIPPSKGYSVFVDAPIVMAPEWLINKISVAEKAKPKLVIRRTRPTSRRDYTTAQRALKSIAVWRIDDYDSWVNIGMILHSLGDAGLELWIENSKRSPKFTDGDCEVKWSSFHDGRSNALGIGTLVKWAKEDGGAK